jgi:integrase/recombinase XerD
MPSDLQPVPTDPSSLATAGFLARYREPTVSAYRNDLRCYWAWSAQHQLQPLQAQRAHLELYLRDLQDKGYAPATIGRRLSTVAGLFRYAVIDEVVAKNPTLAVSRPKVQWEGQRRTVLHPLEFAAVLTAARQHSNTAHALAALLGMLGLRVSEACQAQVTDLQYTGGYQVLHVLGKGSKPADIPLPIPVLRAVQAAVAGRQEGAILLAENGLALKRGAALGC